MSRVSERDLFDVERLPAPVCDCCGFAIEELDPVCPARDEGVCSP